jgi:hypothetical protein
VARAGVNPSSGELPDLPQIIRDNVLHSKIAVPLERSRQRVLRVFKFRVHDLSRTRSKLAVLPSPLESFERLFEIGIQYRSHLFVVARHGNTLRDFPEGLLKRGGRAHWPSVRRDRSDIAALQSDLISLPFEFTAGAA